MSVRTSRADRNYFSISKNVCFYDGLIPATIPDPPVFTPMKPDNFDAIFKVSDETKKVSLNDVLISQGNEAAVDINNRVQDVYLKGRFGHGGLKGDQVLTVKGGSHDITFAGILLSRGKKWDIRYGDWSDQCHDKSFNIDTSRLVHMDGKIIRLVVGRAKWPTKEQLGPNVKIMFWWSMAEKIYWWSKFIAVKTGLLK